MVQKTSDVKETLEHNVTDYPNGGVRVGKWEASFLSHNCECKSLFDCEQEEELMNIVIKYKEKALSSWDDHIIAVNFERKTKILDDHVKKLMESPHLSNDAIEDIKEMIIGDSKLVAGLNSLVFELLGQILIDDKVNEFTKGSAACILGFANFDECSVGLKEKAIEVLVKLISDDCDTISIPVLRTLTHFAYFSADYASFIIENGALEGAVAIIEPIVPSHKRIQNLAKFMVVVVRQVPVPNDKVGAVVTILDAIFRESPNRRCIVRACYILSYIAVDRWVNEGNILNNIIDLIWDNSDVVAYFALRVAACIVKSKNSRKTLTKNYKFLQYLGWSLVLCKPKKFEKEACQIISIIAAESGTFIKDLYIYGLMDALFKLLEEGDFDVRMEAGCTIHNVISRHRYELARNMIDVPVS